MIENPVRTVSFAHKLSGRVSLNSPVLRFPRNPILTPSDVNRIWTSPALKTITVHNAAVTKHHNAFIMLFRSHTRCGRSVLGLARSSNGIDQWNVQPHPALLPAQPHDTFASGVDAQEQIETESGGVEDPRITKINTLFAVTYSAYHQHAPNRVRVCLATTEDFKRFTRHGPMLKQDMRNVVIFPEPINKRFAALFRPNDMTQGDTGGIFTEIRLGTSTDWKSGNWKIKKEPVMKTGAGPGAFSDKIGPGAPPVKTEKGWLNLFHGVRKTMDGNPYVLGVALHDLDNPAHVRMASIPILFPSRADCRIDQEDYAHVPNVVFSCAMLRQENGTLIIYYGGNDTVMNCAATHEDILSELCIRYGQDPKSGELLYRLE
ncbi:MAG: glycosidase [Chitinispirillaceae bacterium]